MSFFSEEQIAQWKREQDKVQQPACAKCGLYRTCISPKMHPQGQGRESVLVVAEAPGREEDRRGTQLIGESGQLLRRSLAAVERDLEEDCWRTNAIICRPPKNRTPTSVELEYCRPNFLAAVKQYRPRVILILGRVPLELIVGWVWKDSIGTLGRWVGHQIPCYELGAWLCPTWHPSYLLRNPNDEALYKEFCNHLEQAFKLPSLPEQPRIAERVRVIKEANEATLWLEKFLEQGGPIAVDYETNMLKPDGPEARIRSCAVCWRGRETISYLWQGSVIEATRHLLHSPAIPKIAANMKFEERWTRKAFGRGVENWAWDTMQAAHVLDQRGGITGLKFQAFVQFGVASYDQTIEQYLAAKTTRTENEVFRAPVDQLLLYGGIDALLEYKLAVRQRKQIYG